jgi:signal peptidase I
VRRSFPRLIAYVVIFFGVLVGLARATAIRWYKIPTDDPYLQASVAPTLSGGDWILLWRLTKPGFGDLALCAEPKAEHRSVIGRIVAVGRDKVEIRGAELIVNNRRMGNENADNPTFTVTDPATKQELEQPQDKEDLVGRVHLRGGLPKGRTRDPVTLTAEPGSAVLVSDNRLFPYDSRDFGLVPLETCKEMVIYRLVSAKGFGDLETRLSWIW